MMPRLSSADMEAEGSRPMLLNDVVYPDRNITESSSSTSWTKKWVNRGGMRQLLLGQWLSVLMAGTGITSTYLADMCFKAPTFQSLGNYVLLAAIFVPVSLFSQLHDDHAAPPPRGKCFLLKPTWWPFALLALIDIEANYLVVLAFEYTSVTSIMLLDCLTIPSVILLSYIFLNYKYSKFHVTGASICVLGVVLIVLSDFYYPVNKDEDEDDSKACGGDNAARKQALLGDFICICGAMLYGVSNVIQETLIKSRGPWEYLARLGIFGSVFGVVQVLILESNRVDEIQWDKGVDVVLPFIGYIVILSTCYISTSWFMKSSDAGLFNLSLLTSDVYTMLFVWITGRQGVRWLYLLAFLTTGSGLLLYHQIGGPIQRGSISSSKSSSSSNPCHRVVQWLRALVWGLFIKKSDDEESYASVVDD